MNQRIKNTPRSLSLILQLCAVVLFILAARVATTQAQDSRPETPPTPVATKETNPLIQGRYRAHIGSETSGTDSSALRLENGPDGATYIDDHGAAHVRLPLRWGDAGISVSRAASSPPQSTDPHTKPYMSFTSGTLTWTPIGLAFTTADGREERIGQIEPAQAIVHGHIITYSQTLLGISEKFSIEPSGIKHEVILSSFEVLPAPTQHDRPLVDYQGTITLSEGLALYANGVEQKEDFVTSGALELRAPHGATVLYLPPVIAYEQADPTQRVRGRYAVRYTARGIQLSFGVPYTWLAAPGRTYPVVLDPTVYIWPPDADAFIGSPVPDHNYGGAENLWVNDAYHSLLTWDLSGLPERAMIDYSEAILELVDGWGDELPIAAHRVTRAWSQDGVTWNSYDGTNAWTTAGGDFDGQAEDIVNVGVVTGTHWSWVFPDLVAEWHSGHRSNYGILLQPNDPPAAGKIFGSAEGSGWPPELEIVYTQGPVELSPYTPFVQSVPSPDWYGLTRGSFWNAIAIQPPEGSDYDLRLSSTDAYTDTLAWSMYGGNSIDIVLIDGNHAPEGDYYPTVWQFSGRGPYRIEHATHSGDLELGANGPYTMALSNLARIWDISLTSGTTYQIAAVPQSGDGNLDLALFQSDPGNTASWYQGRGGSVATAQQAWRGVAEILRHTATANDWHGFVVTQDSPYTPSPVTRATRGADTSDPSGVRDATRAPDLPYPRDAIPCSDPRQVAPPATRQTLAPDLWGSASSIPSGGRYRAAGASCDGETYYVFGGNDYSGVLDEAWQYDPASDAWTMLSPMPYALMNMEATCIGHHIYLVGGYDGTAVANHFQIYDITSNRWITSTWPQTRTPMTAGWDGKLYAFGGYPSPSDETWVYDPATDTWDGTLAPMPVANSYGTAVTVGDYIYQIGGGLDSVVQRYDPANDTWDNSGPQLQDARMSALTVWYGDRIYVVSGGGAGSNPWSAWDTTEVYDPAQWPDGAWAYDDETVPMPAVAMAGDCARDVLWGAGGHGSYTTHKYLDDGLSCHNTTADTTYMIYVDTTSPTCTFQIKGGAAFANNSDVTLDADARDDQTGLWEMRFNNQTPPKALILQDQNPWGLDAIQQILINQNIAYDQMSASDIPSVDMSPYNLVIIPSVQGDSFCNTFNANLSRFKEYAQSGGILVMHGATYSSSTCHPELPGGGTNHYGEQLFNYVVSPTHPLMTGLPATFYGSYASRNYFTGYPTETVVLASGGSAPGGNATLIEYPIGSGRVIASGQTPERGWAYDQATGPILENTIAHAAGHMPWSSSPSWVLSPNDGVKTVYGAFRNHAGMWSEVCSDTITIDSVPPTSNASAPDYDNAGTVAVDWSADDDVSGVDETALWAKFGSDGTWTNTGLTQTGTSGTFDYTPDQGDGAYYLATITTDQAGNAEATPSGDGDTATVYDTTAPTSNASPPDYDNAGDITVNWSASDALSGVDQVALWARFGSAGAWADTGLAQTGTSGTFEYTPDQGDGTYYFATRATDAATNLESTPSGEGDGATIYDTVPPVAAASGVSETNETTFQVNWSGSDSTSGVASYDIAYRVGDDGAWTSWKTDTTQTSATFGPDTPVVVAPDQTYYFRARATDQAGNTGTYASGDGDCATKVLPDRYYVYLPLVMLELPAAPCGPDNDYCEPYNGPSTAYGPLQFNVAYRAYPDDKEDYYYFYVTDAGIVQVQVTDFAGGNGNLIVYAESDTKNPVSGGYDGSGNSTMTLNPTLSPGKYYVRVYTGGATNSDNLYTLIIH